MKVKELIARLAEHNPDAEVFVGLVRGSALMDTIDIGFHDDGEYLSDGDLRDDYGFDEQDIAAIKACPAVCLW